MNSASPANILTFARRWLASETKEVPLNTRFLPSVLLVLIVCLLAAVAARADDAAHLSKDQKLALVSSLHWQTGTISLKDGLAQMNLGDSFHFLGSDDARKVLHQIWNNPDDPNVLGLLFPKDDGPLDDAGYAVTVEYEDGGYVKDDDADKIDYAALLKTMQTAVHDANDERVKEGYETMELVGWAQPPHYDKTTHKLYWAKEFKFGNSPDHVLNYDLRILGRHGTLVLTVLGDMQSLPEINADVPKILSVVDFQPGNTYAEFDPKIDKVAEYGLAGLIAGGALAGAAKLGLLGAAFKWIIAAVIALKKLVIVLVLGIVAAVKKAWSAITGRSNSQKPGNLLPPGQG
jgi:uncharacterized membrane-anchored protein